MNAQIVRALAWEEWLRVRAWWGWALAVFVANSVLFWAITDHGPLGPAVNAFMREFDDAYTVRIPTMLFLLTNYAIVMFTPLVAFTIIATSPDRTGISAGIPGRYLTLPAHRGLLSLIQMGTRLALTAPFIALPTILYAKILGRSEWTSLALYLPTGPLIGLIGVVAVGAWWRRLGPVAIASWLVVPLGFWGSDLFFVVQFGEISIHPAIGFFWALIGMLSGTLLLGCSAPFETLDLPMLLTRETSPTPRSRGAFSGPNAAVRWAERPFSIWWPLGLCVAFGLVAACNSLFKTWQEMATLPWVPWTPWWIKLAGAGQLAVQQLAHTMLYAWPMILWLVVIVEAFLFLRRNYLRQPFAARLPVGHAAFAWHAHTAVLSYLLRATCLATGVAMALYTLCDGNNLAAPYLWDSSGQYNRFTASGGYLYTPIGNMSVAMSATYCWQDGVSSPVAIGGRMLASTLLYALSTVTVAWLEMFPANWAMIGLLAVTADTTNPIPWESLAVLGITAVAAGYARGEGQKLRALLLVGLGLGAGVFGIAWTTQLGDRPAYFLDLPGHPERFAAGANAGYLIVSVCAFLLLPFASLWTVLKLRSQR